MDNAVRRNVCVPRLELLPDFDRSGRDAYQWLSVPRITQPEQFSSLTGLPIVGLPAPAANLTADFTAKVSYVSLACSVWDEFPQSDQRLARYKAHMRNHNPFRHPCGHLHGALGDAQNTTWFLDANTLSATRRNVSAVARHPGPAAARFAFCLGASQWQLV